MFHGLSFLCMGWEKGGILGAMAAAGKFAWDWAGAKRVGLSRQSSLKAAPVLGTGVRAAGVAFARRSRRASRAKGAAKGRREGRGAFRYNPPL